MVDELVADRFRVDVCCRVSGVSRASYYEYRGRPLSATELRRVWLTGLITEIHTRSRQTYGLRRVHTEMTLGMGVRVSKPTIEKLMRLQGLQGIPKRKGVKHFKREVATTDLVNREFLRTQPGRLWVTDIPEHPTIWIPVVVRASLIASRYLMPSVAKSWDGLWIAFKIFWTFTSE